MSETKKKHADVGVRIIGPSTPITKSQSTYKPITKAEIPTKLEFEDNMADWIEQNHLLNCGLMVKDSSILPQCIKAYRQNIAGFGIGVRFKEEQNEPTSEMLAEKKKMEEIIELLNFDCDTKECFESVIEARERFGIAYLEVIRNAKGEVVEISFIENVPSITKSKRDSDVQEVSFFHNGVEHRRKKRFRKYRQQVGSKTVYYKEFGDPRQMNNKNGEYTTDFLDDKYIANEILEFKIGQGPYGEVRWFGQILNIDGSRRAENLNNNYFKKGRHTPLLIAVNNGTISDESYAKLQEYMNGIEGENGQHKFLLLETEKIANSDGFGSDDKPQIEIKDLASILQKDELFQEYITNNRKRCQSAFQLPDIYLAYTTDFNRATALAAMKVTEQQVFQPERFSLAWKINNQLLNGYNFRYVEAYFLEPDLSNPDDIYKILVGCNNAGGVTPNRAKAILDDMLNEKTDNFDDVWGNVPTNIYQSTMQNAMSAIDDKLQKSSKPNNDDEDLTNVMKEVRYLLQKAQDGEIYENAE